MKRAIIVIGAVLAWAGAREARAVLVPVNSNSVVLDGIEYYMQTDKSVYDLGEDVEMLYRVTNLTEEDVTIGFRHGPESRQCDFIVEKDGETVWDTTHWGVLFSPTWFVLKPSESNEYIQLWNMTYSEEWRGNGGRGGLPDNEVTPGIYDITGVLSYYPFEEKYVPVTVEMQIIPEPATFGLMGIGLLSLLVRKRQKRKDNREFLMP